MNLILKFIGIFLIILNFTSISYAENLIKFINVDKIISETNIGKELLNKINNLDQNNIDKLKSFEKEIQDMQNDINQKKNVISEQQFKKEVDNLKKNISDFNNQKNNMVKELNEIKNQELSQFFEIIKPIIQNYMNDNSIDMIINSKNIFIGNKNSDLTNDLIKEINTKFPKWQN